MKTNLIFLCLLAIALMNNSLQAQVGAQKKQLPAHPASSAPFAPADTGTFIRDLRLSAHYTGDSVLLRWKPANPLVWKSGNLTGYQVIRFTVDEKSGTITDSLVLTTSPLKPYAPAEWQTRFVPSDTLAKGFARLLAESKPVKNGTFGEAYARKNANDYRFAFAMLFTAVHPVYAPAMALGLTDRRVDRNKTYIYTVQPAPGRVGLLSIQPDRTVVHTDKPTSIATMPFVQQMAGDKIVTFKWSRALGSQQFVAYYYERSADGGKTFRRISNEPFIGGNKDSLNITLIDSLPRNYVVYQYRITGITVFGPMGQPSTALRVMGRDLTPPLSVNNLKAVNTKGSNVQLTWTNPAQEGDFAGFVVGKGQDMNGPFTPLNLKLLPNGTTQFNDPMANSFGKNYYAVTTIDTAGNARLSVPAYVVMLDEAAPSKPTSLTGGIDSTGRVTINWKRNMEPDLLGYMVYVANAPDHTFTPLTPDFLADEQFSDSISLRTLSEKIYYRVVAFDKSRRASPYSEILELKKPDRIRPVSPVFDRFLVADSSVTLHWARSSSEDVTAQWLYRKDDGKDANYMLLTKLDAAKVDFVDRTVLPRHGYQYTLVAVDDSQNQSERSFPQRVRTFDAGIRPGTQNLSATAPPDKPVQLQWKVPATAGGRILVYRKINDQPLRLIDNLPGSQQNYQDVSSQKGRYQYALKTVYADGGESPLSAFVRVDR